MSIGATGAHPWPVMSGSIANEVVQKMDVFYEVEANITLPMITAYRWGQMRVANVTEQQLREYLGGISR